MEEASRKNQEAAIKRKDEADRMRQMEKDRKAKELQ